MIRAEMADHFARIDALQAAAAQAAPAIEALVAVARQRGERSPYKLVGVTLPVATWCRKEADLRATPIPTGRCTDG